MKEKKPKWCPHKTCIYLADCQNLFCIGKLPKPIKHDNDFNTHRFCIDERETKHGIHDLQINKTDAWNFIRLLKMV